jgi:UDP-glucuronate decarboxylase
MLTSCIREDVNNILKSGLPWERFAGKRILVTGASGFLPGYFVETLLALKEFGHGPREVVGLVRNLPKAEHRFSHHAGRKDFSLYRHDLSGPLTYDGKFDYIIHAASQASPRFYSVDPVGTILPNVLGTYHLLDRAHADGCEGFLLVSSGAVYGVITGDAPVGEDSYGYLDPTLVRSCYFEAKRMSENLCVCMHHQYDVPVYIARPAHTYGPGLAPHDGRVFSDFIEDIAAGRDIVVKSDGSAKRPFCYASDAIVGMFAILLKGEIARPYNVGNDETYVSIRELAETLAAVFSERGIKAIIAPEKKEKNYVKNPSDGGCPDVHALRALGWKPTVGIKEGFRRTVASIDEELISQPARG